MRLLLLLGTLYLVTSCIHDAHLIEENASIKPALAGDKEIIKEYLSYQPLPLRFKDKAYLTMSYSRSYQEKSIIELTNFRGQALDLGYDVTLHILSSSQIANDRIEQSVRNTPQDEEEKEVPLPSINSGDVMLCVYESFLIAPPNTELFLFGSFLRSSYEIMDLSKLLLVSPLQEVGKGESIDMLMGNCFSMYQQEYKAKAIRNLMYFDMNLYGDVVKQVCNARDKEANDCRGWYENLRVHAKENSKAQCIIDSEISYERGICELRAKDNTPAPILTRIDLSSDTQAKYKYRTSPLISQFVCDTKHGKKIDIVREGSWFDFYEALCSDELRPREAKKP